MEIGVVVHGPGIIDSGWALEIINLLSNIGNVKCRLGGTIGRTAVIDASLEDKIDISTKLLPSESLELFNRDEVDVIFLLNYGKSSETGHTFGYKVFNHYFKKIANEDFLATNYKPLYDVDIPVIQIERPGEEDGSIIQWNLKINSENDFKKDDNFESSENLDNISESVDIGIIVNELARILSLNIIDPRNIYSKYFSEKVLKADESVISEEIELFEEPSELKDYVFRKIQGVSPGENIFVNNLVIGKATSNLLILMAKEGEIVDIIGGKIKAHGLEKLGKVDLNRAIVKTGLLRKTPNIQPRVLEEYNNSTKENSTFSNNSEDEFDELKTFKVAYLDHAACDVYKFKDVDLVVSVGDDTTLLASDILYRFNVPIIGITDGDLDKVVQEGFINKDSVIFEFDSGYDDIVGKKLFNMFFLNEAVFEIPYPNSGDVDGNSDNLNNNSLFELDFKYKQINKIKNILFEIIKELDISYCLTKDIEDSYENSLKEENNEENNNFLADSDQDIINDSDEEYSQTKRGIDEIIDKIHSEEGINSSKDFDGSNIGSKDNDDDISSKDFDNENIGSKDNDEDISSKDNDGSKFSENSNSYNDNEK